MRLEPERLEKQAMETYFSSLGYFIGGGFGGAIASSIASTIVAESRRTVYHSTTQYRHSTTYGLAKNDYKIYRHSTYTSLIGSGSGQFYYSW